jgi:CHAT domain
MIEVAISPVHVGDTDLKICLTNSGPYECLNVIFVIRLPAGVMRLRGQERIGPIRLPPGEAVCEKLRVRSEKPGRYPLTSPNFSYKDHNGRTHRESSFTGEIIVAPSPDPTPSPTHEPRISTELQTRQLPLGEWTSLHCRLSNVSDTDAQNLELRLSGQFTVDERSRIFVLERLAAGAAANASFYVHAPVAGAHVPVYFDLTYSAPRGRRTGRTLGTVRVSSSPTPASTFPQPPGERIKVLYLAADPVDPANRRKRRLRIEEEFREIQQTVSQGRERDSIQLESRWAVQSRDITQALFDVEPHFVHFAGHGDIEEGSIVVADEYGDVHTIPVDGLVRAFQAAGHGVRCVVVNACSTERLAQALAAAGLCVIGMRQPVGDQSAVRFSIGFYQALAAGRSVETAFSTGVAHLMMTPLGDDARAPFLLCGAQEAH